MQRIGFRLQNFCWPVVVFRLICNTVTELQWKAKTDMNLLFITITFINCSANSFHPNNKQYIRPLQKLFWWKRRKKKTGFFQGDPFDSFSLIRPWKPRRARAEDYCCCCYSWRPQRRTRWCRAPNGVPAKSRRHPAVPATTSSDWNPSCGPCPRDGAKRTSCA